MDKYIIIWYSSFSIFPICQDYDIMTNIVVTLDKYISQLGQMHNCYHMISFILNLSNLSGYDTITNILSNLDKYISQLGQMHNCYNMIFFISIFPIWQDIWWQIYWRVWTNIVHNCSHMIFFFPICQDPSTTFGSDLSSH